MKSLVFALLFIWSICNGQITNDEGAIDIAAFNVRVFGASKIVDDSVTKHLVNTILRYDVIAIQEIRDSSGKSIQQLFSEVKKAAGKLDKTIVYKMKLSPRLGRTMSKEEYAFIYRADILTLTSSYTFFDTGDVFEREPFIARFKCNSAGVQDFAVAVIHTSPRDAQNEISNLTRVYDDIKTRLGIDDVIIMGDFNGGCNYVHDWQQVHLARDSKFYWLIDDSKDTTTEKTNCPYDRIVIAGKNLLEATLPQGSDVFNFDEEFGLTDKQTKDVSDHYPVHMKIGLQSDQDAIQIKDSIAIRDTRILKLLYGKKRNVYLMKANALKSRNYDVAEKFTKSGAYLEILVSRKSFSCGTAKQDLQRFLTDFPDFVSRNQVFIGKRFFDKMAERTFLGNGHGRYKTLMDYYKSKTTEYVIVLNCSLVDKDQPACLLHLEVTVL